MRISNQAIDKFLQDNSEEVDTKANKKLITCTKCKDSEFKTQDEMRKHFKTNWHNFNAKLSARVTNNYLKVRAKNHLMLKNMMSM